MDSLKKLEDRISLIEIRNKRVESDKAWNDSWTRRILIAVFTYLSIALYFRYILQNDPWFNAIVPTVGFLLSTLTLPFVKSFWLKRFYKK